MSTSTFAIVNLCLILGAAFLGMRAFARTRPDVSSVRGSKLLGAQVRAWYFSNLEPFEALFVHLGVRPIALTYTQIAASLLSAAAYAAGLIYTAGFLVLFTGTLDILDGKVARRTNGSSPRGAFLDSVVDRYAEFFGFVGLIVFFQGGWRVWAVLLAILGGMMVSYTRARAEGLGMSCEVGILQRPERFVLLGFGSIFSSLAVHILGGNHELLALTVVLLAVLSNVTALQRTVHISRRLERGANA
jgi:CDP-diacylglycerol--glycerol-3-phosphate 3-phosphatidyltransferase